MAAPAGGMYILVNVDKHREVVGEIVNHLIIKHGVPISVVDDIQKICPKCCRHPSSEPNDCTSSTPLAPPTIPVASSTLESLKVSSPSALSSAAGQSVSTSSEVKPSGTNMDLEDHKFEEPPPAPKRSKIEEEFPILRQSIKEELVENEEDDVITIDDDAKEVFGTVLAVMNGSQPHQHSSGSSEDGTSNSNDNFDVEDDEFNPVVPWSDTNFLANFITSQPDIFHANRQPSSSVPVKKSQPLTTTKRAPPPIVSNGKTRRGRIVYTQQELVYLERCYEEDPNACANSTKRDLMCKELEIDYHRLKVWFQNRRRKDKLRSQEGLNGTVGHTVVEESFY